MYQLYSIPGSCSTGIHVLLNQLEVPVEIRNRDEVENYQNLVATNQVPALETGDQLLTEGAAIALHLLNTHGDKSLANDPEFTRWLMFNYATLHPAYSKLFAVNHAMENGPGKLALLQTLADRLSEFWQIVDQHLEGREFMHNDQASVIDYLIAVYVRWGSFFPDTTIALGDNVLNLVNRVVALPEFQSALQRENISYSIPENTNAAAA